MSKIVKPDQFIGNVQDVSDFLKKCVDWQKSLPKKKISYHTKIWYRGLNNEKHLLLPGVYRENFANISLKIYGREREERGLNLEREMLAEFRSAGALHLDTENFVQVYLFAQHYRMPTRLLDWTSNPLVSLFFACSGEQDMDEEVLILDVDTLLPPKPSARADADFPRNVVSIRHPYVTKFIGQSFWRLEKIVSPYITPLRPDSIGGRISQPNSCFTLHPYLSDDVTPRGIGRFKVPKNRKNDIKEEIKMLNINKFTIYGGLDNLADEIKHAWLTPSSSNHNDSP